jgi:hypothetical protein
MSTSLTTNVPCAPPLALRATRKVWREISRPFRRLAGHHVKPQVEPPHDYLTGSGASIAGFHPQQATVEAEGLSLIERLVVESRKYRGPIIEIGTLIGITTTKIALAKAPEQKVITVDAYCWNPWGLSPDTHEALASQMLHYLVSTGHVEMLRIDKNEFYETYRGPAPAMAFLDAWHDYEETKKDIEWAKQIGANIICGHDYCDEFAGVKQIVDEMGGPRELAGTVWVL